MLYVNRRITAYVSPKHVFGPRQKEQADRRNEIFSDHTADSSMRYYCVRIEPVSQNKSEGYMA